MYELAKNYFVFIFSSSCPCFGIRVLYLVRLNGTRINWTELAGKHEVILSVKYHYVIEVMIAIHCRYPNIDPCAPFVRPVKYSHFFGSLIYPFVQVEINNINPHYVGYTYTNLHADLTLCVLCTLSQILRRHTNVYVTLKTFTVLWVLSFSILWRFEINLLNYLFMSSTTI